MSTRSNGIEPAVGMRSEIDFGLALATFLGGLWYLHFDLIQRLTLESPAERMLSFFAFAQGLVFALFVFSLFLLFDMGRALIGDGKFPKTAYRLFVYLWPLSLFFTALAYVVHLSQITDDPDIPLLVTICVSLVAAIACIIVGIRKGIQTMWLVAIGFVVLLSTSIAYVMAMPVILADVHIETDKAMYKLDEPILVSVRTSGYVANPTITRIEVEGQSIENPGPNGMTFSFTCTANKGGANASRLEPLIKVYYQLKPGYAERKKTYSVRVAFHELSHVDELIR